MLAQTLENDMATNTKRPAGVMSFDEKHSSRTALDAFQTAYDEARSNGLSHREAGKIANQAAQDARDSYNGRR